MLCVLFMSVCDCLFWLCGVFVNDCVMLSVVCVGVCGLRCARLLQFIVRCCVVCVFCACLCACVGVGVLCFLKRVCIVCDVLCDGVQSVFVMCVLFVCAGVREIYVCVACD